jgi:hypothetical protein
MPPKRESAGPSTMLSASRAKSQCSFSWPIQRNRGILKEVFA